MPGWIPRRSARSRPPPWSTVALTFSSLPSHLAEPLGVCAGSPHISRTMRKCETGVSCTQIWRQVLQNRVVRVLYSVVLGLPPCSAEETILCSSPWMARPSRSTLLLRGSPLRSSVLSIEAAAVFSSLICSLRFAALNLSFVVLMVACTSRQVTRSFAFTGSTVGVGDTVGL